MGVSCQRTSLRHSSKDCCWSPRPPTCVRLGHRALCLQQQLPLLSAVLSTTEPSPSSSSALCRLLTPRPPWEAEPPSCGWCLHQEGSPRRWPGRPQGLPAPCCPLGHQHGRRGPALSEGFSWGSLCTEAARRSERKTPRFALGRKQHKLAADFLSIVSGVFSPASPAGMASWCSSAALAKEPTSSLQPASPGSSKEEVGSPLPEPNQSPPCQAPSAAD